MFSSFLVDSSEVSQNQKSLQRYCNFLEYAIPNSRYFLISPCLLLIGLPSRVSYSSVSRLASLVLQPRCAEYPQPLHLPLYTLHPLLRSIRKYPQPLHLTLYTLHPLLRFHPQEIHHKNHNQLITNKLPPP